MYLEQIHSLHLPSVPAPPPNKTKFKRENKKRKMIRKREEIKNIIMEVAV